MFLVKCLSQNKPKGGDNIMKKVLAILFAMMFVVATTGLCFAQAAPAAKPAEKAAPAPEKKADDKKAEPKKDAKKAEPKKAEKKPAKKDAKKAEPKKAEKKEAAPEKKAEEKKAPEKK
jgi:outer membrane biosynthesis protein TonB